MTIILLISAVIITHLLRFTNSSGLGFTLVMFLLMFFFIFKLQLVLHEKRNMLICRFQWFCLLRSRRPKVLCKKDVLRNFARFTGNELYQRLFFDKIVGLRPASLFKRKFWHKCFCVNFVKFLRTHSFIEYL